MSEERLELHCRMIRAGLTPAKVEDFLDREEAEDACRQAGFALADLQQMCMDFGIRRAWVYDKTATHARKKSRK